MSKSAPKPLNPWAYAESTNSEHAEQVALFMWCNMAANFGIDAANDRDSYDKKDHALTHYGPFQGEHAQPLLKRLFAIHNQGHGDVVRGMRARAEGVKTGVPDMMLPVPQVFGVEYCFGYGLFAGAYGVFDPSYNRPHGRYICGYHGLWIELKRPSSVGKAKGSTQGKQDDWIEFLLNQGYAAEVCVGWEVARDCILKYLGLVSA